MTGIMDTKTVKQILSELLEFKTVTGNHAEAGDCLDYAEEYLKASGLHINRSISNGFPALVATSQATKKPKVLLQAHIDVVAAPDHRFKLLEQDGQLIGRGAYDMKFAAAVFNKVAMELASDLAKYDFGIILTSDEEIGGVNGVKALLDDGYRAEVCILPDAGDNWHIETSHKGSWLGRLVATGKNAHGSRPWEGENAINRLVDAICEIKAMFEEQHLDSDTFGINQIEGGTAINQVADHAEATFDLRFINQDSYDNLHQRITSIARENAVDIETIREISICETDTKNPLVASFLSVAEEVHGKPLGEIRSLGTSDAYHFAEYSIPTILSRPLGGSAHADDEWIDAAGLEEYCQLIKSYVVKEAKIIN
mgnify:CR=1 FL=1